MNKNLNVAYAGLVNKYIGTAYDVVKLVHDNLPTITSATRNEGFFDPTKGTPKPTNITYPSMWIVGNEGVNPDDSINYLVGDFLFYTPSVDCELGSYHYMSKGVTSANAEALGGDSAAIWLDRINANSPEWVNISNKPDTATRWPTAAEAQAVSTSTTVNNKALTGNITLNAADVSALPDTYLPDWSQITNKPTGTEGWPTPAQIGAVPITRTVNNKALDANITLNATDVGAIPPSRTVNNKALVTNITLTAADVGALADTYIPDWSTITNIPDLGVSATTVIPHTGGGLLTALRNNEIRDGGEYTLPLANSVLVNQVIHIDLPDTYKTFTPVVSVSGSDTIVCSIATDTSITFDLANSESITLTSDGVSVWRL